MNFGPMGGGAAAGLAGGFQQGWKAVDDARTREQGRRIREQEMTMRAQRQMQEMMQQQMQLTGMGAIAQKTGADQLTPIIQQQQQQLQQMQGELSKMNGNHAKSFIEDYAKTPPQERDQMLLKAQKDEQLHKALGVKNPQTIRTLDPNSKVDMAQAQAYYAKFQNPLMTLKSPEEQQEFIKRRMQNRALIGADGKIVDVGGLAQGIGVSQSVDPEDAKEIKQNAVKGAQTPVDSSGFNQGAVGDYDKDAAPAPSEEQAMPPRPQEDVSQGSMPYYPTPREVDTKTAQQFVGKPGVKNVQVAKNYLSLAPTTRKFYDDFAAHMKNNFGVDVMVPSLGAGRTKEDQAKLYAKGRTAPGNKVTWTMNSHHIGGNAADIISSKGYKGAQAKKENDLIAREMRKFAEAHPEYGAGFLSMAKDPNHVQFTGGKPGRTDVSTRMASNASDKGLDLAAREKDRPATGGTMKPQEMSWLNRPYNEGTAAGIDKWELYRQVAGLKDPRPASVREMDYIAQKLGPEATNAQVMEAYAQFKNVGSDQLGYTKSYMAALKDLDDRMKMKYGDEWETNPEAMVDYRNEREQISERQFKSGTSGVDQIQRGNASIRTRDILQKVPNLASAYQNQGVYESLVREEAQQPKLNQKVEDTLMGGISVARRAKDLSNRIREIGTENLMRGNVQGLLNTVAKMAPRDWVPEKIDQMVDKTIGLDTELGTLVSDYLKIQSGTAVNKDEAIRLIRDTLSATSATDPERTAKALETFAKVISDKTSDTANYYAGKGYGATGARVSYELKKALGRRGFGDTALDIRRMTGDIMGEAHQPDTRKSAVITAADPKQRKPEPTQTESASGQATRTIMGGKPAAISNGKVLTGEVSDDFVSKVMDAGKTLRVGDTFKVDGIEVTKTGNSTYAVKGQ